MHAFHVDEVPHGYIRTAKPSIHFKTCGTQACLQASSIMMTIFRFMEFLKRNKRQILFVNQRPLRYIFSKKLRIPEIHIQVCRFRHNVLDDSIHCIELFHRQQGTPWRIDIRLIQTNNKHIGVSGPPITASNHEHRCVFVSRLVSL